MTATSLADSTMRTLSRDVERDRLAHFQPELAWGLLRRLLGAYELGVGRDGACLQRLERDIGRHQLGEGCREPLGVGIFGVEHRAVIAVSYTHLRAHETPEHLVCRL